MRRCSFLPVLLFLACGPHSDHRVMGEVAPDPVSHPRQGVESPMKVVGYLPFWDLDRLYRPALGHLTDLIFFNVETTTQGHVLTGAITPEILAFVHGARRDWGLKIHLSLADLQYGSDRSQGMAALVRNPRSRTRLTEELTALLVQGGWDGLDVDWEYPRGDAEEQGFAKLLAQLKAALAPRGLELTIAASPWHVLPREIYRTVDGVNMMVYDNDARTASWEQVEKKTKDSLLQDGIPREKYRLGLPFYGTGDRERLSLRATPYTIRGLRDRYDPRDDVGAVGGYAFDSADDVARKVRFAKSLRLGGLMIWEVNQDSFHRDSYLELITRILKEKN